MVFAVLQKGEPMSDLISRQTAIDAFERFIHELGIKDEPYNYGEMALSAQNVPSVENKGEPCDDCISRKDAIQALKADGLEGLCRSLGVYPWNVIKMLPSIQPTVTVSENPNKWIPVSERLPKERQAVLCWAESTAERLDAEFIGMYDTGDWFLQSDVNHLSYPHQYKVVAWMPLPEPYKAERGE